MAARFFRLPILQTSTDDADDLLINTEDVSDVKRFGNTVEIIRKYGLEDFVLDFGDEDAAIDFINKNFLIFNA